MNYCKLHSFVGTEQDSKDCSECHIEREKEIPFLANLRVNDEKCMYCGGEGAMCQKCKDKFSKKCPFCKKAISSVGVICPCEVRPKYDADYEEWKDK